MQYLKVIRELQFTRQKVNLLFFPKVVIGPKIGQMKKFSTPLIDFKFKHIEDISKEKIEHLKSNQVNCYLLSERAIRVRKSKLVNSKRDYINELLELFGIKNTYYEFYFSLAGILPNIDQDFIFQAIYILKVNNLISIDQNKQENSLIQKMIKKSLTYKKEIKKISNLSSEECFAYYYYKIGKNKYQRQRLYKEQLNLMTLIQQNKELLDFIFKNDNKKKKYICVRRFLKQQNCNKLIIKRYITFYEQYPKHNYKDLTFFFNIFLTIYEEQWRQEDNQNPKQFQ